MRTLAHIGRKVGVARYGGNRQWAVIVYDGVPYTLGHCILSSMCICSTCYESLPGGSACDKHKATKHPNEEVSFDLEFNWVLLQPSLRHVEMNMVMELGWDLSCKTLAFTMNFRSDTALNCAQKSD